MKTQLFTVDVKNALTKLKKVYATKTSIAILENVKVEVTETNVIFTVANYDFSASVTVTSDFKNETGIMLYDFKKLSAFVSKAKSDFITLDGEQIFSNNIKYTLTSSHDTSDFPNNPDEKYTTFDINKMEFKKGIEQISYAASKSESRPILNGINFITDENGNMQVACTDSHRLAIHKFKNLNISQAINTTIPATILGKMVGMIDKKETENSMLIGINERFSTFNFDNVKIFIKNLEGNYPNIDRLIPSDSLTNTTFVVNELIESLDQLSLIYKDNRNQDVRLDLNGKAVLSASERDNKENETNKIESKLTEYNRQGSDLVISFNGAYIKDVLKVTNETELTFNFNSPFRPFTMTSGNDTLHLLLPIRTV